VTSQGRFAVILAAAGKSRRFADKHYKKPFAPLEGRPVWMHSAEKFLNRDDCVQLIMAIAPEDREYFNMKFAANVAILGVDIVDGGKERTDSVAAALNHVKDRADHVAVHDAARPCLVDAWISAVFAAAMETGAAIPAVPVTGTLKRVGRDRVVEQTVSRDRLWEAQTPQAFRRDLLEEAYAARQGSAATDDAQLVEQLGHAVTVVPGSSINLKITSRQDLRLAEAALKALPKPKLSGPGHPFADDRWR